MISELPVRTIAHAISLAVAPVFLMTGIASILSVLTNRLSRIIDRSRYLQDLPMPADTIQLAITIELKSLQQRARLIHLAIGLGTLCLLLICTVVAILFLGSFVLTDMSLVIASLFVAAMLCLIIALLNFMAEIYLATAHVRGELPRQWLK
ncbi:MAG: DUF2721 domain-containing protein [Methylococcales bacterium]|nr:DUF2721 domain-containing protein [Methylococcales bacterium]